MKISSLSVVVLALTIATATFGQIIPKETYIVAPQAFDDGTSRLKILWPALVTGYGAASCEADLDPKGEVTTMWIHLPAKEGTASYGLDAKPGDEVGRIEYPSLWKKFVSDVRKGFWFGSSSGMAYYVETAPWELSEVAYATSTELFAPVETTLIFKRGGQSLPVALDKWKGEVPALKSKVIIGRWNGVFGPATKTLDGYLLSSAMITKMAEHGTTAKK